MKSEGFANLTPEQMAERNKKAHEARKLINEKINSSVIQRFQKRLRRIAKVAFTILPILEIGLSK